MRTDHYAYQRAAKVAGLGLLLQLAVGLTLLVFGRLAQDTTFVFGSIYVLLGVVAWLALIIVFYQQQLERLEALEEDEMAAARAGASSVFDAAADEARVAARRLHLMYAWLMPAVSLLLAALLSGLAWLMLRRLRMPDLVEGAVEFQTADQRGWGVAICLGGAAVSFVFSRFVAGMAKQPAWQNLRGGAAWMVGNAVVMLAIAVGIIFRFFENDEVIRGIAYAIPAYMVVLALEIALNFVLHIYRPRIPGEMPRPAFDSKLLSLLATPDNLVRSINEAVNYQFGFDVTSSWGYQLLLRSFVWLVALGLLSIVVLNTIVVVEPHQQAVKLSRGRIMGDVHGSGIMWKLPWPLQSAEVYDVTRIRVLPLTARPEGQRFVHLWQDELETTEELDPFIVGRTRLSAGIYEDDRGGEPGATERVSDEVSLVDAVLTLQYRIRPDAGLLDYLGFAADTRAPRSRFNDRQGGLRHLAVRAISQRLAGMSLDDVLAGGRAGLAGDLRARVQAAFDDHRTGVEVVSVNMPIARPAGSSAATFEELGKSHQARLQRITLANRYVYNTFTYLLGDAGLAEAVLAAIDDYERLKAEHGSDAPEVRERRMQIQRQLFLGRGEVARVIAEAEKDRWVTLLRRRAQSSRIESQLVAYRAAPDLYRQREMMRVISTSLANVRKYIVGIDPARLNVDVELQERNPLLDISDALGPDALGTEEVAQP
ncbi:MAG: SPFH domain-containing protein [Planctomycetota bacterium]|jgi:regulator of protease activity HflC (stomatin/prohibitin superfamily)